MPQPYKYHLRPGYGSENLLLEFFKGADNEDFGSDFFDAIKSIRPKIIKKEDIWLNDELLYTIDSEAGQFTISRDGWGFTFIMSDDQSCILKINRLLYGDRRFEKVEVDGNKYR